MMSPEEQLEKIAKSQSRQQMALIVLSIVLAASLIVTWKSLTTMREANALQREQLVQQKPDPAPQAAPTRKSIARPHVKANASAETHASPSNKERTIEKEASTPSASTNIASARTVPERQGRQ
jgi:hypothetical protein